MNTSMRYEIKELNCIRLDTLSEGAKIVLSMLEDISITFTQKRFRGLKFFKDLLPSQVRTILSELVSINILTCKSIQRYGAGRNTIIYTQLKPPKGALGKLLRRVNDLPEFFSFNDIARLPKPGVGSAKTISTTLTHAINEGYIISHATHRAGGNKAPCIKYTWTSKAKELIC